MSIESTILAVSASLGLWLVIRRVPTADIPGRLDQAFILLAAALVGARLDFTLQHTSYYRLHLAEAFAFWQGGLGWLGAFVGGSAALLLITLIKQRKVAEEGLIFLPILPPLAVGGWLASWASGAVYGAQSLLVPLPMLAAATLCACFFALHHYLAQHVQPGIAVTANLTAFAVMQFLLDMRRIDPRPPFLTWPIDRWGALVLMVIGLCLLAWQIIALQLHTLDRERPSHS